MSLSALREITDLTGWLAVVLLALTFHPYFLRRGWDRLRGRGRRVSAAEGRDRGVPAAARPWRARLWLHYWMAYTLLALALVHTMAPMRREIMRAVERRGILLAMCGLLLLALQVALGLWLRSARSRRRESLRRIHLWSALALGALVLGHVILNG
jgi:hypothetical protein